MPLTESANKVEAPRRKDFVPVPEDIYQVVIRDVEEKIGPKYMAKDEDDVEAQYLFKIAIIDGEGDAKNAGLTIFCAIKWFTGGKKYSPSKLVNLFKACYAFYYPKIDVTDLNAEDITPIVVNDLIGCQLRVAVKYNADKSGNKITEMMSIKKELAIPEEINLAHVPAKLTTKMQEKHEKSEKKIEESEDITPNPDIPF